MFVVRLRHVGSTNVGGCLARRRTWLRWRRPTQIDTVNNDPGLSLLWLTPVGPSRRSRDVIVSGCCLWLRPECDSTLKRKRKWFNQKALIHVWASMKHLLSLKGICTLQKARWDKLFSTISQVHKSALPCIFISSKSVYSSHGHLQLCNWYVNDEWSIHFDLLNFWISCLSASLVFNAFQTVPTYAYHVFCVET